MYICPICGKSYKTEETVAKCFLACWREKNLVHQSNPVPRTEVIERQVSNDILEFFKAYD